jgi:hypothetical protein
MLEQSTALPWSKPKFACASMLAFRSHVIASHCPRLFQPPRSRTKPTLPDLACSCIGVSQTQPLTYRIALSKSKNPARCSVVLALGESNSKTIERVQKTRLLYDKTTQYPAGFSNSRSSSKCHSRRFGLYMILLSSKPLWSQIF